MAKQKDAGQAGDRRRADDVADVAYTTDEHNVHVEPLARDLFVRRSVGPEAHTKTIESLAQDCLTRAKLFYQALADSRRREEARLAAEATSTE